MKPQQTTGHRALATGHSFYDLDHSPPRGCERYRSVRSPLRLWEKSRSLVRALWLVAFLWPWASPVLAEGIVSTCDEASLDQALTGGGTVTFTCSGTITLTATKTVHANTVIDGGGTARGGNVILSGGGANVRLFEVVNGAAFTVQNLTLDDSHSTQNGSAIYLGSDGVTLNLENSKITRHQGVFGGAIYIHADNSAMATITNSVFENNQATCSGGAIVNEGGTIRIAQTTFTANRSVASGCAGGAISQSSGAMTLTNVTLADNHADLGGGLHVGGGTVTILNSAIVNNTAAIDGGGLAQLGQGAVTLEKTLVAGNTALVSPDISGTVISQGNNLVGDITGTIAQGTTGDMVNPMTSLEAVALAAEWAAVGPTSDRHVRKSDGSTIQPPVYNFSTSAGTGGNTVGSTPNGSYAGYSSITVQATPDPGYAFDKWAPSSVKTAVGTTMAVCGTGDRGYLIRSGSFEMPPQTLNCSATFTRVSYQLTVGKQGTGSGTITGTQSGFYAPNTEINLQATAAPGSSFDGWNDKTCGISPRNMMAIDTTCIATFTLIPVQKPPVSFHLDDIYYVNGTTFTGGEGLASLKGSTANGDYVPGTSITIQLRISSQLKDVQYSNTAPAELCSSVTTVSYNGDCYSGDTCKAWKFPMPEQALYCRVYLKTSVMTQKRYTLKVGTDGNGRGSVVVTSASAIGGTETFVDGTKVTLKATPEAGSQLSNWNNTICSVVFGDGGSGSFYMPNSDLTCIATFTLQGGSTTPTSGSTTTTPTSGGTTTGTTTSSTTVNYLRGGPSSPLAVPKAIAGISPATPYTTDLSTWTGGWNAPQALYDQGTFLNSEDYWSDTISPQSASTWQSGGATGKGVLVVDLQTARTINRFSVFQTFSDGKTTHIRVYQHSSTSATVPAYNDAGWVAVMPETSVTAGLNDTANQRIASPTKIAVTSFTSRYLKIEVRNDRSLGNPTYIELKGIKAFGPAAGTTTGTTTTTSTTTTIQPSNYALSTAVAGSGKGNVTGSTPSGSYAPNTAITLRATADAGSTFTGWSPAPCASSFYMPASALTCTATFTLNNYAFSTAMAGTGRGNTTGSTANGNYALNTAITLNATANEDSIFRGWSPITCGGSFKMPAADLTCTATFELKPAFKTATAGTGRGNTTGSTPNGNYVLDTRITLKATPDAGSIFQGWSPAPCAGVFNMPANDLTCTATFGTTSNPIDYLGGGRGSAMADIVKITSISPASISYAEPYAALYQHGTTMVNSEDYWNDNNSSPGLVWTSGGTTGTGVLVVDMRVVRTINRFSVFQSFGGGKTTHIRVYKHNSTNATTPTYDDSGWTGVMAETSVDSGSDDTANNRIANPTKITVTPFTSRYLKIEVRNNGSLGGTGYIELTGIKAFGP